MGGEYFCSAAPYCFRRELPPRARRIRALNHSNFLCHGTTSACAENTLEGWPETLSFWNYLRVRGEYNPARSTSQSEMELPPRARRIPNGALCTLKMKGTTSACAENTIAGRNRPRRRGNYLRVRGEYSSSPITPVTRSELPPRARRILPRQGGEGVEEGTTSACAENTIRALTGCFSIRNYLRVRGEYFRLLSARSEPLELPPRARRIRGVMFATYVSDGTTSACAENTAVCGGGDGRLGNYLRVRGEYTPPAAWGEGRVELPPRARRIRQQQTQPRHYTGTTSACAENTR